MKDPDVYLEQVALQKLGFYHEELDGDRGPFTIAARQAWEHTLHHAAGTTIAARIVTLAIADLGIRESAGKNQGPGIEKYWPATTYKDGFKNREPYCAAAVCYWVRTAVNALAATIERRFLLPTSAKALDFEKWGKNNTGKGVQLIDKGATIEPGDIIVWDFSHVSVAEVRCPQGKTNVQTIDANTSPQSGDNEGGGVYRRTRKRTLIRAIVRILS